MLGHWVSAPPQQVEEEVSVDPAQSIGVEQHLVLAAKAKGCVVGQTGFFY